MPKVNWSLIAKLPADGTVYAGGPEYGAFRVCHRSADRMHAEQLLAETGTGLQRRILEPRRNAPAKWGQAQTVSGIIA